jgi:hypothetical protein
MKSYKLRITLLALLLLSTFANTYAWEDYDDFSGSTLDTNKWEVGYFAGGETVTIVNGQAKLSGSAYSPSSPFQMPSELSAAGQGSTEGNTFLFIKDPTIIGLEAWGLNCARQPLGALSTIAISMIRKVKFMVMKRGLWIHFSRLK